MSPLERILLAANEERMAKSPREVFAMRHERREHVRGEDLSALTPAELRERQNAQKAESKRRLRALRVQRGTP